MSIIWCISITSNVKSWKQIRRNSSTSLLHSSSGKELSHGSTHIWCSDNFEAIGAANSSFWPLPKFWGVMSKMTTLQNFGVPDPPKVGRTRFVSRKKHDLGPIFGTKSSIWPISNIFTPPHDIHRWKAMDLSLDLAASYRDSKHPTSRQNFDDAVK